MKPDQEILDYIEDETIRIIRPIKEMLKNSNMTDISRRTMVASSQLYKIRDNPEEKLTGTQLNTILRLQYLLDKGELVK